MSPRIFLVLYAAAAVAVGCQVLVGLGDPLDGSSSSDGGMDAPLEGGGMTDGRADAPPCTLSAMTLATDPKNCGACGHDCLGGGCDAGACTATEFALANDDVSDLAVYDGYVYWGTGSGVSRKPENGGSPTVVVQGQNGHVIAVDSKNVYIAHISPGSTQVDYASNSSVGENGKPFVMIQDGHGLVAEDGSVYVSTATGTIVEYSQMGVFQRTILAGDAGLGSIYYLQGLGPDWYFSVSGSLNKVSKAGGNAQLVVDGVYVDHSRLAAVDGGIICRHEDDDGGVVSLVDVSTGVATPLIVGLFAESIATGAGDEVFAVLRGVADGGTGGGSLVRVDARDAGSFKSLDDGLIVQSSGSKSTTIAVSDTSIYYVVKNEASAVIIKRLAR